MILSPLAQADCTDVVKTCDALIEKKNELINIEMDRSTQLNKKLQELDKSYNDLQNRQDLFLVGGLGAGAIIAILLMRK